MSEVEARARQHRYLQAMQVDVWQRRERGGPAPEVTSVAQLASAEPVAAAAHREASAIQSAAVDVSVQPLAALAVTVSGCQRCDLHKSRHLTVFGTGDEQARCMIIGEAPGADEDASGEPFVGRAGRLLNAMLHAVGMSRESVYIANIIKCRPPKNRDPKPEEMAACAPYLRQQIAVVRPRVIVALGRVAAQHLAGSTLAIGRMRGQSYFYSDNDEPPVPIVVTYHPAYLLRSPLEKRKSWEDLKRARELLEANS
jgi:DNA polymerase